jgi:uncharacterized membrane protein YidH (DUF202 family)
MNRSLAAILIHAAGFTANLALGHYEFGQGLEYLQQQPTTSSLVLFGSSQIIYCSCLIFLGYKAFIDTNHFIRNRTKRGLYVTLLSLFHFAIVVIVIMISALISIGPIQG